MTLLIVIIAVGILLVGMLWIAMHEEARLRRTQKPAGKISALWDGSERRQIHGGHFVQQGRDEAAETDRKCDPHRAPD